MTRWRIALWSAGAFAVLAVLVHLGLPARSFIDILGGALLATAVLAAVSALIDWLPNRSGNDHESAVPEQRNGPSLTRVGERPTWI